MSLSEKERIHVLIMRGCGDRTRSYQEAADLFNITFPDRAPITKSTVLKTVKRFQETGSVKDRPRSGRSKTATDEDTRMIVMQSFVENPHASTRKVAKQLNISHFSVHSNLQLEKWHPYKMILVQELKENDYARRIDFCDKMMRLYDIDRTFFDNIIFSDEATFQLTGEVNTHNCRYWNDKNPRWMRDEHTQYPEKLNVWCGFSARGLVGSFIINGNLNGGVYLNLLRDEIVPAARNSFKGNLANVWFQQDGAPPHNTIAVRNYLNATFPNRWIGYRRPNYTYDSMAI